MRSAGGTRRCGATSDLIGDGCMMFFDLNGQN